MSWTTLGEYVGRTCRKDRNDTKNQSYGYKEKTFLITPETLLDKTILYKTIFWIVLAIKFEEKVS